MSIESKTTHEGASKKLLPELSQPIHANVENVSQNTQEIIDENGFYVQISKWENLFKANQGVFLPDDQSDLERSFEDEYFLEHLVSYVTKEISDIYQYGNIDTFSKISFVGFLFCKKGNIFSDIHNMIGEDLKQIFNYYESKLLEYSNSENQKMFLLYMKLYLKFLDFVGIVSMFHEMDHDRRKLIFILTKNIYSSIQTIQDSKKIEQDQPVDTQNNKKFSQVLEYIGARTGINSKHLEYIAESSSDNLLYMMGDFAKILNSMYSDFSVASRVGFLGYESKKTSLTSAFIANVTTLMQALIQRTQKLDFRGMKILFNHPDFLEKIMEPYKLQIQNAFGLLGDSKDVLMYPIHNFEQFKNFCNFVVIKNYHFSFAPEKNGFGFNDILDDIIEITNKLDGNDQVDFRFDFCYQLLSNGQDIESEKLIQLAFSLVESTKSNSYHTEAVKLKLIDITIKKLLEKNISGDVLDNFLGKSETYILQNKKNSIILNVYARLYLTLSFAYSKIPDKKEKSLFLYFMYEELNTSKILETFYGIESSQILKNLFPNDNIDNIHNHPEYIWNHERFVEKKWHETQKKINQIPLINRIEGFERALEILSEEFFYGMVDIYVVNQKVDKIPKHTSAFSSKEFDIYLEESGESILHKVYLYFPNNYKLNFDRIWSQPGKQKHLEEQIHNIFEKLGLYILPTQKEIQNEILEALENGEKKCVPYFQPIVGENGVVVSYECLMRILNKEGKPLRITKSIGYNEDGSEKFKIYAIDEQLKVAAHLGITTRITQKLIIDAYKIAKQNPAFEFNINLSYEDIMNDVIFDKLKDLATQYPRVVGNIVIELLENKIHHNSYFDRVKALTGVGYKVAVDDFGSEYNNISILSQLHKYKIPVYKLKIDQVVIRDIVSPLSCKDMNKYQDIINDIRSTQQQIEKAKKELMFDEVVLKEIQFPLTDQELNSIDAEFQDRIIASRVALMNVQYFITLAQQYKMKGGVVAEYVDNGTVFNQLKNIGVHGYQGYYIGQPNSTLEILKE